MYRCSPSVRPCVCCVDVQFHVNRACAARAHCAVPVSSTLFGDPWIRYDSAEKLIAWKETGKRDRQLEEKEKNRNRFRA